MKRNNIDWHTIDYLCERIPELKKALDRSRLVQVPVRYKKKDGTMGTRLQWVDKSSKEAAQHAAKQEDAGEIKASKQKEKPGVGKNTYAQTESKKAGSKKPKKEIKPIGKITVKPGMHLVESAKDIPAWITEQTGKIPPGWRFIQVTDDKESDVLVCGYDYSGQLQSKYSKAHEQRQAALKFKRVEALRANREKVESGIRGIKNADVRDCLLLIMNTALRPGSTKSAKGGHYGATTLLAEHVVVEKSRVYLRFVGKEGVDHDHEVLDADLCKMLKKRKKEAEKREDKRIFQTSPETLNKQFKAVTECVDTSVKDLRTMKACETAYDLLKESEPATTAKEFADLRNRIGDEVCAILGNGRTMALGSYIDPRLFIAHSPEGYQKWKESLNKNKETDKKAG